MAPNLPENFIDGAKGERSSRQNVENYGKIITQFAAT
jgi:hypothetical protein